MEKSLIELHGVSKVYRSGDVEVAALRDIHFSVAGGEFVSIVGASGSGKSTLMNIIGCLDAASSGEYLLSGERIDKMDDKQLSLIRNRRIGFIFQGFHLVESLSALENVELPLVYRRLPRAECRVLALDALERVGLSARLKHRPGQMSGGQQQRVAIARAIAAAPELILADEPTGNLDSESGGQIVSILRSLHREGRTIVLITHDLQLARRAGRTVQMKDGCLLPGFAA